MFIFDHDGLGKYCRCPQLDALHSRNEDKGVLLLGEGHMPPDQLGHNISHESQSVEGSGPGHLTQLDAGQGRAHPSEALKAAGAASGHRALQSAQTPLHAY